MSLQETFATFGTRLRNIGKNEPLTRFSFFLVLLLDIFIFSMIFAGISENTETLSRPEEYANYDCTNLIAEKTKENQRDTIMGLLEYGYEKYSYSSYPNGVSSFGNAPGCTTLEGDITAAKNDTTLSTIIKNIRDTEEKIRGIKTEQNNISSQYDTMLLEKIADQKPANSLAPTTAEEAKGKLAYLSANLATLENSLTNLRSSFDTNASVKKITDDITNLGPTIQETYDSLVFWYPVKRFSVEILFILPLLLVTLWWSRRSTKHDNGLQMLISSHLLGIVSVFILIKAIDFLIDILPKKLFEQIYEILVSWNIIGLLYYVYILLGIAITMGVIYFIQKKVFSPERLQAKRADRGQCYLCGEKLMEHATHCIRCGESQEKKCPSCGKMTNITSRYCGGCGAKV